MYKNIFPTVLSLIACIATGYTLVAAENTAPVETLRGTPEVSLPPAAPTKADVVPAAPQPADSSQASTPYDASVIKVTSEVVIPPATAATLPASTAPAAPQPADGLDDSLQLPSPSTDVPLAPVAAPTVKTEVNVK